MANLTYIISTGQIFGPRGLIGVGYSGKRGPSRNNPDACWRVGEGPCPPGRYRMISGQYSKKFAKPYFALVPVGHKALGRGALMIHGDNWIGDASTGCIVFDRPTRRAIEAVAATYLVVVARPGEPSPGAALAESQGELVKETSVAAPLQASGQDAPSNVVSFFDTVGQSAFNPL